MTMEYSESNHPKFEDLKIGICYLCGKQLSGITNKEHIIPNNMFAKGSEHRPQLLVHQSCNNGKSMVDERFKIRMLTMSSLDPKAAEVLTNELLIPANLQKMDAGLIGKSNQIRDYKLARTIAKDFEHQFDLLVNGQKIVQVRASNKHVAELNGYASKMTRGLFIRNVPGSSPGRVKLYWIDKKRMALNGDQLQRTMEPLKSLIDGARSQGKLFAQVWPNIGYLGTESSDVKNAGFVWVEFYNTFGVVAFFRPPRKK